MTTTAAPQSPSPLDEATPESLNDLFSRDPLDLAEPDIEKIVQYLRSARERWDTAESQGKKSAPRAAKAPAAKVSADPTMSLDDLGL